MCTTLITSPGAHRDCRWSLRHHGSPASQRQLHAGGTMVSERGTSQVEVRLPRASRLDTMRTITTVVVPLVSRGMLLRRPPVVALPEKLDADRRAVRLMQRLRHRYGP